MAKSIQKIILYSNKIQIFNSANTLFNTWRYNVQLIKLNDI